MSYSVHLVRVLNEKNRKLIAHRLAGDLSLDPATAESRLSNLPVEIAHRLSAEKAQQLVFEYEKLGCLLEKASENLPPEAPRRETPHRPAPKPAPEKPHSGAFSFSQNPEEEAPQKKVKLRRPALVALALGLLIVLVSLWVSRGRSGAPDPAAQLPDNARAGDPSAHPPEDPALAEEVDRRLLAAERAPTIDDRIAGFKEALALSPSRPVVKRRLSRAYADRAQAEFSPEARVRFFQLALSFNPMNSAASEGLARAYRESGDQGAEKKAAAEWKKRLRDSSRELSRTISGLGNVSGLPRIVGDTLILRYKTGAVGAEAVEAEMRRMADRLRLSRNFEEIRITAQGRDATVTRAF